jgi:hypothetical protein
MAHARWRWLKKERLAWPYADCSTACTGAVNDDGLPAGPRYLTVPAFQRTTDEGWAAASRAGAAAYVRLPRAGGAPPIAPCQSHAPAAAQTASGTTTTHAPAAETGRNRKPCAGRKHGEERKGSTEQAEHTEQAAVRLIGPPVLVLVLVQQPASRSADSCPCLAPSVARARRAHPASLRPACLLPMP